jgi:tripartite-type tricarboxylate transporter receptor subunit TctC
VLAPAGTPLAVKSRLVDEMRAALRASGVANKMLEWADLPPLGPAHFAEVIHSESRRWRELVQAAGIKVE